MATFFIARLAGVVGLTGGLATGVGVVTSSVASARTSQGLQAQPKVALPHTALAQPTGARAVGAYESATVTAEVALAPRDQTGLARRLSGVYSPESGQYHRWLPPGQFDALYAPQGATVAAVKAYLHGQGLGVSAGVSPFLLRVQGSSAHMETAFGTRLERYEGSNGQRWWTNSTSIKVPAGLVGAITGVVGLNDFKAHPATVTPSYAHPRYGGGPNGSGLTPSQLNGIYGGTALGTSATAKGSGVTMGLLELSKYSASDITTFAHHYISASYTLPIANVTVDGGPVDDSGDIEVEADAEVDIGQVPDVKRLDLYNAPNTSAGVVDAYATMATSDQANVISTSWGICEAFGGATVANAENTSFEQMALQGQSMFAAAGDNGAYDCGTSTLAVDDPGTQPYVTAVGGTSLNSYNPGTNPHPTYPPAGTETLWNDSCTTGNPADDCSVSYGGASGGGVSTLWARPPWQSGLGTTSTYSKTGSFCGQKAGVQCREVPDVSANADVYSPYSIYCSGNDGGLTACLGSPGWVSAGGTSVAAPLWATIITRWVSAHPSSLYGDPAVSFYPYAGIDSSLFHDIFTHGSGYEASNGYYPVTAHYDMATGLGTPDITNIVKQAG